MLPLCNNKAFKEEKKNPLQKWLNSFVVSVPWGGR